MNPQSPGSLTPQVPTLFVGEAEVSALAEWPAAVAALRSAYARPMTLDMVPPRVMARGQGFWMRGLFAISPSGDYMGCKLIAASPKIHRASYLVALFDQRTMDLAALIDGSHLTGLRTAATAAVAVDLAAPQRPLHVALIGSGFEARNQLEALMATRQIASVRVFSPTPASRERFAASFREQGVEIQAVAGARAAIEGADVVCCAARSRDETPVIQGAWLEPGMTVVSIGSTLPEQREVDTETFRRAALIVADMPEEVEHDTGDAIAARAEGVDVAAKLVSLADVASGKACARRRPDDIVLYKSVGSALQDVVIAEMLFQKAQAEGRCLTLPQTILTIDK